jgi:hypothetical protein
LAFFLQIKGVRSLVGRAPQETTTRRRLTGQEEANEWNVRSLAYEDANA